MEQVLQRVSKLEEKTSSHEKRLDGLEEKADKIPELSTLMTIIIETNNKTSLTLENINTNLTELNGGLRNLDKRVETLEEGKKETKRDIKGWISNVSSGLFLAFLIWYFGFK